MHGPILRVMPARRKPAVRITALALAFGANASLFLLLWFSRSGGSTGSSCASDDLDIHAAVAQARSRTYLRRPPDQVEPRAPIAAPIPAPEVIAPTTQPSTAITLPPIDWYAEGQRAARNAFPDNARVKPEASLDSPPKAMELPDLSDRPHKRGDTEPGTRRRDRSPGSTRPATSPIVPCHRLPWPGNSRCSARSARSAA